MRRLGTPPPVEINRTTLLRPTVIYVRSALNHGRGSKWRNARVSTIVLSSINNHPRETSLALYASKETREYLEQNIPK